jgi:predicted CopG family antitoxin
MSKTITIDDDVYKTLLELKQPGDSFTKVLRRHVNVPARNNEELLSWHDRHPEPQTDPEILKIIRNGRGRRSGGRK